MRSAAEIHSRQKIALRLEAQLRALAENGNTQGKETADG